MIPKYFIDRPIFAAVLSILLVLGGMWPDFGILTVHYHTEEIALLARGGFNRAISGRAWIDGVVGDLSAGFGRYPHLKPVGCGVRGGGARRRRAHRHFFGMS